MSKFTLVGDSPARQDYLRSYGPYKPRRWVRFMGWLLGTLTAADIAKENANRLVARKHNLIGLLLSDGIPVMCGCGGSGYLCVECATKLIKRIIPA